MNCQQETLTFTQWVSDPNTILAIVVIIVSISSFGFTVWYSKKILKLNIKPFLMIVPSISDVEVYGKVEIQNKGLGTAVIDSFSINYGNHKSLNVTDLVKQIVDNASAKGYNSSEVKYKTFNTPKIFAIGKDEKIIFFEASLTDAKDYDAVAYVIKQIFKLTVNIEYHDMNGKKFKDSFEIK
jgi:hypothetical protein